MNEPKLNIGTRIASMLIDHFIMTIVSVLFSLPLMIKCISSLMEISHEESEINFDGPFLYLSIFGFAVYLCKDTFNGRSIGKRLMHCQVVNNVSGQVASPLKCFIRNLFCIVWIIEVICILANPSRRIGDHVAGTKVVRFDPSQINQSKFNLIKSLIPLAISYCLLLLFTIPFLTFQPSLTKTPYQQTSYNAKESQSLERLYNDSLGNYMKTSVKIFDTIAGKNLPYISIIHTLNEDYLANDEESSLIEQKTEDLLLTRYSSDKFTGRSRFVYKTSGSIKSKSIPIGRSIDSM